VLAAKTLKVATDASWAPQSFMNDKNEMDGFDIDVAKEIGKHLGVSVEFVTPGLGHHHGRQVAGPLGHACWLDDADEGARRNLRFPGGLLLHARSSGRAQGQQGGKALRSRGQGRRS
jgi:hypothetical protein